MSGFTRAPWMAAAGPSSVVGWPIVACGAGPGAGRSIASVTWMPGLPDELVEEIRANANLIAAAPEQDAALNYVADMTFCGADGEWHFKVGYCPQVVLDAIAKARGAVPTDPVGEL